MKKVAGSATLAATPNVNPPEFSRILQELISLRLSQMLRHRSKGLLYVFTGNGKGKTTAAVGQAVRAVGQGQKVLMVQFIKQITSGEVSPLKRIGVEIYPLGRGFVGILGDQEPRAVHIRAAREALDFAKDKVSQENYDLLVLDEINVAISLGLLKVEEVLEFLRLRPDNLSVIVTGRNAPKELIKIADLVSEVREIKHPFSKGISAKKGSEF